MSLNFRYKTRQNRFSATDQSKAAGASLRRSPTKKAGKVRKERGEVAIRGRLVEGEGVRGRAN
jgi:hypothetical protein